MANLPSGFGVDWKAEFDKIDLEAIQHLADVSQDFVCTLAKKMTRDINNYIESFVEVLNKSVTVDRADIQYPNGHTTIYNFYSGDVKVGIIIKKSVVDLNWYTRSHDYKIEFTSEVLI